MRASRPADIQPEVLVENEAQEILRHLQPLVEGIAGTFGPNFEVVLHDLRTPEHSIVAIANGHVTGRRVGGPIIGGPLQDKALRLVREYGKGARVLANYATTTPNGKELKSTSIVYYSRSTGQPIVAFCLNYDLTALQAARAALDAFLRTGNLTELPSRDGQSETQESDLETMIRALIKRAIEDTGKLVALMNKDEKSAIVGVLDGTGLFMIRGAVERVAHALGVSRFTVYNYLKEIRNRN